MHYIDVVIDNKSNNTDEFYTYEAPDEVNVGARVSVPFARRKKPVDAYCIRVNSDPSYDVRRIKAIEEYFPERSLTEEMISTAVWMRRRYGVKYIDAVKMFTVGGKRVPKVMTKVSDEQQFHNTNNSEIETLQDSGSVSTARIIKSASKYAIQGTNMHGGGAHETAIQGNIESFRQVTVNDPGYSLSGAQRHAADRINEFVRKHEFRPFLIKGVTNSGKTEVYMRVAEEALRQGRSVIVLLPEIALAQQVEKRFASRFGKETVATLHSKLRTSARLGEWMRIRSGEARIVVGARTSVFAPMENIGAIIIDEEHETTYKSDHNPKYETVDVAFRRAQTHGAVLVMGSATPSITSYNRARSGIYELLEMNERIGGTVLPTLEIVDMCREIKAGNTGLLSRRLAEETDAALARGEQAIFFLNRRGFSTQILCPDCGYRMTCPDCGISLTYHKSVNAAVCHYCSRKFPLPDKCPDCGNKFIRYTGAGTEKVEESVRELWPDAAVARFDLDTAGNTENSGKVISDFQKGRTDILVGTQLLAKGLNFRNVGLVGIINADVSLNIPDYRSPERTFQLITQVAGRAGRTGGDSRVIIQTYDPDNDIIKEAAAGDYESFYEAELLHRNIMNYPPYSDIISVGFVSESYDEARSYAEAFRKRLLGLRSQPEGVSVLRVRMDERKTDGRYKAEFMIKAPQGSRTGYVREYMEFRDRMIEAKSNCFIEIDINPY